MTGDGPNFAKGMSVRVYTASGWPTDVCGIVTRTWMHEGTQQLQASIAAYGRRWEGDAALLRRIEQINPSLQLELPPGVR